MPLPVLVLSLPTVVGGIVSIFAAAYSFLGYTNGKSIDEIKGDIQRQILDWIIGYAANKAGLVLDGDDPLSDASFCGAIGERTGITFRTLKDKVKVREDLESYAAWLVSEKSGYQISSVTNIAALRSDLERIGAAIITERTGIPLGSVGAFDPAGVREQVLLWAKAELLANMGDELGFSVQEIISAGGIEAVASDLNSRLSNIGSIEAVTSRQLAVKIAEKMASSAVADFGRAAGGMDKKNRKRALGRAAQAKFRAIHGNRQRYVPLGMGAVVT